VIFRQYFVDEDDTVQEKVKLTDAFLSYICSLRKWSCDMFSTLLIFPFVWCIDCCSQGFS